MIGVCEMSSQPLNRKQANLQLQHIGNLSYRERHQQLLDLAKPAPSEHCLAGSAHSHLNPSLNLSLPVLWRTNPYVQRTLFHLPYLLATVHCLSMSSLMQPLQLQHLVRFC